MSDRKRQRYTPAFKAEAVRLYLEGDRTAAVVARELGVRPDLLRKWKQEQVVAGTIQETVRALTEAEQIRQLKRNWRSSARSGTFLKKPRRSLRKSRREVRLHSPPSGPFF